MKRSIQFYVYFLLFSFCDAMHPIGLCHTGCNAAWHACYHAAGLTVSHIVAVGVAAVACNAAQGACMSGCWYGTAAIQSAVASPHVFIAQTISSASTSALVSPFVTGIVIGAATVLIASYGYSLYTHYHHKSSHEHLF